MQTLLPALLTSLAAALVAGVASAAGLGGGAPAVVLGQPLDFAVQVRLDAGETLSPECVVAEVTAGDRRVQPSTVRVVIEMTGPDTARLRVQTQGVIDEPVVGVQLSVGCGARLSRRYVVLADPPSLAVATVPAFAATPAPVPMPEAASATAAPAGAASAPRVAEAIPALASSSGTPGTGSTEAPPPRRATRAPRAAKAASDMPRRAEARPARERLPARVQARDGTATVALASPAPRLKLESADPPRKSPDQIAVEEALVAVAQAASAARAAASAASASAERMAVLERHVEGLRTEAKASKDLAAQLRQRLNDSESSSVWMLPLMVVSGLLAALSAFLAWRLGRAQAAQQQRWREAAMPVPAAAQHPTTLSPVTEATPSRQPTAPIPFVTSELRPAPPPAARSARAAPAWPPPAPPVAWPPPDSVPSDIPKTEPVEPPMQRTEALPAGARGDEDSPRDVSIEELIDLEQQADFFVVLGQDEAAIDLLMEHVRSTGGGSPLPYLKLLEIHHKRDDREAYERLRGRFNHRFNAYAPEWGVDLTDGRALDDYAGVIPRLQQVWPRPLDAMAELEALLFRKSRGELFDLPAYREVLFLYSLARDLLDRAAADTGNVDLLLPLADGTTFGSTAPSPFEHGLERDAFRDTMPPDDRPTAPLDFDVTGAERPTSIFDLLDEKTQPKR